MSAAVLRSLDREREKLTKRRVLLTSKERKLREQLAGKLARIAEDASKLDEQIAKVDSAIKALEAVFGPAAPSAARVTQRPVVEVTPDERKVLSSDRDGKPASDRERVRLALVLKGEMNNWQIAEVAGVPSSTVHLHLSELAKRGEIVKVSRGRYKAAPASKKGTAA